MKIFIVGAGQVGSNLAFKLNKEGHDVTIIDKRTDKIEEIEKMMDVRAINSSLSPKLLKELDVASAHMLIAVTDVDEINLISCQIARKYNVLHKIARVNNLQYDVKYSEMDAGDFGADLIINQMSQTAAEVVQLVRTPGSTDIANFSDNEVELVAYRIHPESLLANRHLLSLKELEAFQDHLVVAINRDGNTIIPSGKSKLLGGDKIYIIGRADTVSRIAPLVGNYSKKVRKVMIFGGTALGAHLAEEIEKLGMQVALIEPDKDRCFELTGILNKTIVIHGSGSDLNMLKMEGIQSTDVFISVTLNEESNLLACMMAKRNGTRRTMALIQKPEFMQMSSPIGVDVTISPKISTEGAILKYVRKGKVHNVASIKGTDTEVLEIEAEFNSMITAKAIKDLNIPKGVIIGAIKREHHVIIPSGNTQVQAGDRVIIFHLPMDSENLSVWFTGKSK